MEMWGVGDKENEYDLCSLGPVLPEKRDSDLLCPSVLFLILSNTHGHHRTA